ncbi:MAG: hypothetical protein AVW06_02860 [Hadesarchaea archaeon DG-33-1]|nr:MAG: hypothetical protein AVW06_02860 [Hadesarchaea archaeon DG-33-1]
MEYYKRLDVKRAILDFARASDGSVVRESAFFNSRAKRMQRYISSGDAERGRPIVLDSEAALEEALRAGASAFYCSYWRYAHPQGPLYPLGRDLVWTIRATSGGLKFAKEVTVAVLDALADVGLYEPWVKYSGELGFDLVIPLETIPSDAWADDTRALADTQGALTSYIVSHLTERSASFQVRTANFHIAIGKGSDTCLLSELRLRRGLFLAPMSLNPRSGLVSLPLAPEHVTSFSVLDASPADASAHEWTLPQISWNPMKQMSEWRAAASAEVKASVF